jgi:AcrR family transcriptional regulator
VEPVRDRILAAAISLVVEEGYEEATVAAIAARAGSTGSEFDECFSSVEDCCRDAFDAVCDRFDCHLLPIYLRPEPWRKRMRAAALAAVDFCRAHEEQVRFAIGEQLRHPHHVQGEQSLQLHLGEIDAVRHELAGDRQVPASAAEFAVGCFLEGAIKCHANGDMAQLEQWLPDLMYVVTDAFFGSAAAEEELVSLQREIAPDAGS